MRPGRDADPSPPSSVEVKNKSRAIPLVSLRVFVAYERVKPTYIQCVRTLWYPILFTLIKAKIVPVFNNFSFKLMYFENVLTELIFKTCKNSYQRVDTSIVKLTSTYVHVIVIIRINGIFYIITSIRLHVSTVSIGAIFRMKYYLLKKVIYTIDNIVVDCEISHYVFKILRLK